jgi:formylglycine-generating enzyme required for sulfatase activity/uncharacterized caspase-like protein
MKKLFKALKVKGLISPISPFGRSHFSFPVTPNLTRQTVINLVKLKARYQKFAHPTFIFKIFCLVAILSTFPPKTFSANRAIVPIPIYGNKGTPITIYKESHALIIGVSDYKGGWPQLPGVKGDIKAVKEILEKIGFHVVVIEDPNQMELESTIKNFVLEYGLDPENRLLFYYAGHGYTHKPEYATSDPEEWMGYLVSKNAPDPRKDIVGFFKNALSMRTIENIALTVESKHALFIFDSCFSGTIFGLSRSIPQDIQERTAKPVRQFISSGTADQVVPDHSIFRRQLISALKGEADRNGDNYVTGSELGYFLEETVTNISRRAQTPRYGKIQNRLLNKGDFVFNTKYSAYSDKAKKGLYTLHQKSKPAEQAPGKQKLESQFTYLKGLDQKKVPLRDKINAWMSFISDYPINNPQMDLALDKIIELRAKKKRLAEIKFQKKEKDRLAEQLNLEEEAAKKQEQEHLAEEKRLISKKSDEMEVARLEPGIPKVSPEELSYHEGMVLIPAGRFVYGKPGSQETKVLGGFYMDIQEVTQKDYERVIGKNPSGTKGENHPVEKVTWQEAKEYCQRIGKRLPTSEEWEKAARGGTSSKYYWGNTLRKNSANCNNCNGQWDGSKTDPVGSFPPNPLGLYDMAGNVWEWVEDSYNKQFKVLRGGSWMDDFRQTQSAASYFVMPDNRSSDIGFRCAKGKAISMVSQKNDLNKKSIISDESKRPAEEKRLISKKFDEMKVARLEPGIPKVSPEELSDRESMVLIPAGRFVYGEPGSQETKVLGGFYMDVQEVTQKDYKRVISKNPSRKKGENHPVEKVTWQEAKEYCQRIGKRLPTSEEWEKAARGGTSSKYYWGNTLGKNNANCNNCDSQWDGSETAPVQSFPPNPLGLYDMAGNVWEWVEDSYNKQFKVLRGGSWMDDSRHIQSAASYFVMPDNRSNDIGFRCAKGIIVTY